MKKFTIVFRFLLFSSAAFSQNGLESVIVENYYVSDAYDSIASDGVSAAPGSLPVGSVTYRIYADMLPGYRFQAAYGVNTPGADHELRIQTTTLFYNNEDRGATSPTYSKSQAANNTVMLDSWLSVGAACTGNFGILKSLDDGVANVSNNDGVLQNNDPSAGIPLTVQDGFLSVAGRNPEPVTAVGITTELAMFDAQNDGTNGPLFSTWNGSWASLNGSIGPDSIDNKVLIAQVTTNGTFSFELNIQIGTPTGGVENYVALNPVASEIQIPSLVYNSATEVPGLSASGNASLKIFPNPASDHFYIETNAESSSASYSVYDAMGALVLSKTLRTSGNLYLEKVSIVSLPAGLYFVTWNNTTETRTQKLLVN